MNGARPSDDAEKVEIKGGWPALRAAVNADIARLKAKYSTYGYIFSVTFGVNP